MENIVKLPSLYKRDTTGKIRIWEAQYGGTDSNAATRTVSGLVDGQKVTSEWNISLPKNVGKVNATTSLTQAKFEAESAWDRRVEREYFEDIKKIDSYEKFKPMLAADYTKNKIESGYSQPKLDGIRCIANKDGLWTRAGKPITSCPHIWNAVKNYFVNDAEDTVLDGELYNHKLKADFNKITSLVRKTKSTEEDFKEAEKLVEYHIYDITWESNTVPVMKFEHRFNILKSLPINEWFASDIIKIVETTWCANQEELDAKYSKYTEDGYEGQIVRKNAGYENKRTKSLLKRKEFITDEFQVIEVLEGLGNWSGYAKRFVLSDGTKQFGAGVKGTQEQMKQLWESNKKPDWATVRFFNLTPDGIPRFPVVVDYGPDVRED